jgi:hypothetical protein
MLCCGLGRLRTYGDSGRVARSGCDAEPGGASNGVAEAQ